MNNSARITDPFVEQNEAVRLIQDHYSRLPGSFFNQRNYKLQSIELIYVPLWCFRYHFYSPSEKREVSGLIAIEPYQRIPVIVPEDLPLRPVAETDNILQTDKKVTNDEARSSVFWEVFVKEKKRKEISLSIEDPFLLYAPYWAGYLNKGKKLELVPVDALRKKLDFPMVDTILPLL